MAASKYATDEQTTRRMRRIKPVNTGPERIVRRVIRGLRLACRLYVSSLPGRPDIVLPAAKKVIFVHGCFWHRHAQCERTTMPRRNMPLWKTKFRRTIARDRKNVKELRRLGWKELIVWECETRNLEVLRSRLGGGG